MAKVYVSSTIVDLKQERQAVMDWLAAARHQVVHSYRPDSDTVRASCLADVDECDLYVVIVGHRYGFQPPEKNPEGLSITHLEFRRAGDSGKPRVALVRTSIPDVSLSDMEDPDKWARVRAFREEVSRQVRTAEFADKGGLILGLSTGVIAELAKQSSFSGPPLKRRIPAANAPPLPAHHAPRQELLREARAALLRADDSGTARMVGLVGMGGAGKSVLACALAHDGQVRRTFQDGIVWLHLGQGADPRDRQTHLAEKFGDYLPAADSQHRLDRLNDLLRGHACLVILDDVWDHKHLHYFKLSAPKSALLVTTRIRDMLDPSVEVSTFPAEPARRLLAAWAKQDPAKLPGEAEEVVDKCAGLPLALAIAGGMVAAGHTWRHLRECIRQAELHRLKIKLLDYNDEYENLFQVLDASVSCLEEKERHGYLALAVFKDRGEVPVEVAFQLWHELGLNDLDNEDLIIELGSRSLLRHNKSTGTFTMHSLQFLHAQRQLGERRVRELHTCLADAILRRWGGLDSGLPVLRASHLEEPAERYGVLNLTAHLEAAGREDNIHQLLALESAVAAAFGHPRRVENTWYAVHERIGETIAYSADVRLAHELAKAAADEAFTAGGPPPGIGLEIRYALVSASISNITASLPPRLIAALVDDGHWTAGEGLKHARLLPAAEAKARALADLLAWLNRAQRAGAGSGAPAALVSAVATAPGAGPGPAAEPPHRAAEIAAEAVAAARAIDEPPARASMLTELAGQVPRSDRASVVAEAWEAVTGIQGERARAQAQAALAAKVKLPKALWNEALGWADVGKDPSAMALVRAALVPQTPRADRPLAVDEARAAIDAIIRPGARSAAWVALIRQIPRAERATLATPAGQAAAAIPAGPAKAAALIALAAQLPVPDRDPVVHDARNAIEPIRQPEEKAAALTALIPMLSSPDPAVHEAQEAIEAISQPEVAAAALTALIFELPAKRRPDFIGYALDVIARIHHRPGAKADALVALIPLDAQSEQLQNEAVSAISEISQPAARATAFTALASHLRPGGRRSAMLARALAEAGTIDDAGPRARGIAALAPHLPEWDNPAAELDGHEAVRRALGDARDCGRPKSLVVTLAALAPVVPEAERPAILKEALVAAYDVVDPGDQVAVLTALLPQLAGQGRSTAIERACAAARAIRDPDLQRAALAAVVCSAPDALTHQAKDAAGAADRVLSQAATLNGALTACGLQAEDRPRILLAILTAPALAFSGGASDLLPPATPRQKCAAVFRGAQDVIFAVKDLHSRAVAVATMTAEGCPGSTGFGRGTAAAGAIDGAWSMACALTTRLPELPDALGDELLAVVRVLDDARSRAAGNAAEPRLPRQGDVAAPGGAGSSAPGRPHRVPPATPAPSAPGQSAPMSETVAHHPDAGPFLPWVSWRAIIEDAGTRGRTALVSDLSAVSPALSRFGDSVAVPEVITALLDVGRWWP